MNFYVCLPNMSVESNKDAVGVDIAKYSPAFSDHKILPKVSEHRSSIFEDAKASFSEFVR